jgi:hypothetical protein
MTDADLCKAEKTINGEDHPGDVWFVDTIQELVNEVRSLRTACKKSLDVLWRAAGPEAVAAILTEVLGE